MIYVGNHLQKISYFKYEISTSSQCVTKQVVHKGTVGENFQFFPSCWILKVQYFKGSFELNLTIWLQFTPPPWGYLDKNASTSVFFYPGLEYFWYDFILPEVQVVNELHKKKSLLSSSIGLPDSTLPNWCSPWLFSISYYENSKGCSNKRCRVPLVAHPFRFLIIIYWK